MLDLGLAIGHHLLIFAIFGILFAEFLTVRPGITRAAAAKIASLDKWYGLFAAAIIVIGLWRVVYAAKGWVYYSHNAFFWAKMASFAAIGLLSIPPTVAFVRWRRLDLEPDAAVIRAIRRYLHIEIALFALLPIFAAAMARGYGQF